MHQPCSKMASGGLAREPLMLTKCSRTLSLASTTGFSSNHLATEGEDEEDERESVSVISRDSDHDGVFVEPKLPQSPSDIGQIVVQKLEGSWIGQGASYGDLYVIASHGATVCCLKKGFNARKKMHLVVGCVDETDGLGWPLHSGSCRLACRSNTDCLEACR